MKKLICPNCDKHMDKSTEIEAGTVELENVEYVSVYITCPHCDFEHYKLLTVSDFDTP